MYVPYEDGMRLAWVDANSCRCLRPEVITVSIVGRGVFHYHDKLTKTLTNNKVLSHRTF